MCLWIIFPSEADAEGHISSRPLMVPHFKAEECPKGKSVCKRILEKWIMVFTKI